MNRMVSLLWLLGIYVFLCFPTVSATTFQGFRPAPLPLSSGEYVDVDSEGNVLWIDYRNAQAVALGSIVSDDHALSELIFGHALPTTKEVYLFYHILNTRRNVVLYSGQLGKSLKNSGVEMTSETDGGMIVTEDKAYIQYFQPGKGVRKRVVPSGAEASSDTFKFSIGLSMWPFVSHKNGVFYSSTFGPKGYLFRCDPSDETYNEVYYIEDHFPSANNSEALQYYVRDVSYPVALLGAYNPSNYHERGYRIVRLDSMTPETDWQWLESLFKSRSCIIDPFGKGRIWSVELDREYVQQGRFQELTYANGEIAAEKVTSYTPENEILLFEESGELKAFPRYKPDYERLPLYWSDAWAHVARFMDNSFDKEARDRYPTRKLHFLERLSVSGE